MHLPRLLLAVPPPPQQASASPRLCQRSSNIHRQVRLTLLWGHCSCPLGPGAHKILSVPSFMRVRGDSEKAGLKLNIPKTKIVAFRPITSRQIHGEKVETASDFIFLGSRITVDSDCSQEIKRHLLLGRKAMKNIDSASLCQQRSIYSKLWFF